MACSRRRIDAARSPDGTCPRLWARPSRSARPSRRTEHA